MKTVEIKSYEIDIEKYEGLINWFFYDAGVFGSKKEKEHGKITDIDLLVGKLITTRKKGFNQPELDKIVKEIKFINVSPDTFEKPTTDTFIAFRNVLNGICDYLSSPVARPESILNPLKKWAVVIAEAKGVKFRKLMYQIMPLPFVIKREYGYSL